MERVVKAELVMVGTELLLGQIVDTNAAYLAERLAAEGVHVYFKTTVGDNWLRLAAALTTALSRADLVITSGGLGPTEDDLTKEVVAAVFGDELVMDEEALAALAAWFTRAGREMPAANRKQAMRPRRGRHIANPRGTAPGLIVEGDGKAVICLPGVPHELRGMVEDAVLPYVRQRWAPGAVIHSRVLKFTGIGESAVEERVRDLIRAQGNPTIAPYAGVGEVRLRLSARAPNARAAEELIGPVEAEIRRRLGEYLFGTDGETLETAVAALLVSHDLTLAVAESCTGGLVADRLTNVPGSSRYFERGVVAYSNRAKVELLGVSEEVLAAHGAVSDAVARAMAEGVRSAAGSDLGLSVTGIAGPAGATADKPVGLVYGALAAPWGVEVRRWQLSGDRRRIKRLASQAVLELLRGQLATARPVAG